jgi:hypothetical protein
MKHADALIERILFLEGQAAHRRRCTRDTPVRSRYGAGRHTRPPGWHRVLRGPQRLRNA